MWTGITGQFYSAVEIYVLFEGWQMRRTRVKFQKDWDLWCDFGAPCLGCVSAVVWIDSEYIRDFDPLDGFWQYLRFVLVWLIYGHGYELVSYYWFTQHFACFAVLFCLSHTKYLQWNRFHCKSIAVSWLLCVIVFTIFSFWSFVFWLEFTVIDDKWHKFSLDFP